VSLCVERGERGQIFGFEKRDAIKIYVNLKDLTPYFAGLTFPLKLRNTGRRGKPA
jgi:hypothetical protein